MSNRAHKIKGVLPRKSVCKNKPAGAFEQAQPRAMRACWENPAAPWCKMFRPAWSRACHEAPFESRSCMQSGHARDERMAGVVPSGQGWSGLAPRESKKRRQCVRPSTQKNISGVPELSTADMARPSSSMAWRKPSESSREIASIAKSMGLLCRGMLKKSFLLWAGRMLDCSSLRKGAKAKAA